MFIRFFRRSPLFRLVAHFNAAAFGWTFVLKTPIQTIAPSAQAQGQGSERLVLLSLSTPTEPIRTICDGFRLLRLTRHDLAPNTSSLNASDPYDRFGGPWG